MSNVANIQADVYEAMGRLELLPWVACSFSMAAYAATPLWRIMTGIFNLRILLVVAVVVFSAGAAIAASATSINYIIIGRVINGFGSAGTYQL